MIWSILGILWLILFGTLLRRARQAARRSNWQITAYAAAVIFGASSLMAFWCGWLTPTTMTDANRQRWQMSQGHRVAREMTVRQSSACLLLCAAGEENSPRILSIAAGLQAGNITAVRIVGIQPGATGKFRDAEDRPDAALLLTARDFDRAIQAALPDESIVIAAEPPRDAARLKWLRSKPRQAPVFWLELVTPEVFSTYLASGVLSGISTIRQDADHESVSIPADLDAAFDCRYRWIANNS